MLEEHEIENAIIDDELYLTDGGAWHINGDTEADWAIEKIAAINADYKRKEMVVRNKIADLERWLDHEKEQAEKQRSFFESKLREYFEQLQLFGLIKQTKTQKVYKLPSGTLRLKQQQPEYIRNDELLLQWVKANKPRFVRIKESVDWAGLKELVAVAGDKVIDTQTGEVIDGVEVVEREAKFMVEVN